MDTANNVEQTQPNQAETYYKSSVDLQMRDGVKLMNSLMLVEGSMVLDLGCGTGNLTAVLAEKVGPTGHVLGVDPDRQRIELARAKITKHNVTFVEADGETYPEGQYDLVFSNYVLNWIEDKEAVFKRVYNNLRPGGQFAFTLCQALPPLYAEIVGTMEQERAQIHFGKLFFLTPNQLEELATKTGYKVTYREFGVSRLPFTNIDGAMDFVYGSSYGDFDPILADKTRLDQLKEKYTNETAEFAEEYASLILVKE